MVRSCGMFAAVVLTTFALCLIVISDAETVQDYICSRRFRGYFVDYKRRTCVKKTAIGCHNPFPYQNRRECLNDFFYGRGNICEELKPCENDGVCSQVTTDDKGRTFKCECASTGFFGDRCEKRCPSDLSAKDPKTLPCLQI
ncbi:uncharacterized protein LOC101862638 [Aplysia californica]|uniref:Uncharacterized protein LOC101862638 n=1 Tax=Aplysia californica TaxID=6500 RepID=A0ABM0JKE1_APLCA|nr:uncharacterized protein LOC101862638 [Aplysia californica]